MAQYQTVAPWIRFEWNTRASADVSSRWQTRAKLDCLLIENWEARNGVGSGTAIQTTFQGQSFGFHMISQSEPPHLPSWISKCQRHLNLRDIGRIHFFSFMLLVDQLNGCLCLSMGSTYPCKGSYVMLCPNLQPWDEDFRFFQHFMWSALRNILWLRCRCVVFLSGLGVNGQIAESIVRAHVHIPSGKRCGYRHVPTKNQLRFISQDVQTFIETSCYLRPHFQSDLGYVESSVWTTLYMPNLFVVEWPSPKWWEFRNSLLADTNEIHHFDLKCFDVSRLNTPSLAQRTSCNAVPVDLVDQPLCRETREGFWQKMLQSTAIPWCVSGTAHENGWIWMDLGGLWLWYALAGKDKFFFKNRRNDSIGWMQIQHIKGIYIYIPGLLLSGIYSGRSCA